MRLLFITDNFPPEVNAPASRTFEHINHWKKNKNVDITVITCFPNFPEGRVFEGYKNKIFSIEYKSGIRVIRVWTYIAPNTGLIKRSLDFMSFAISASLAGIFIKFDIIVATSPQFFTTFAGFFLSKIKNKPWIFELRDLWPEIIFIQLDNMKKGFLSFLLEKIELFLYKDCDLVISLTNSYKENLIRRGINKNKIKVITNGVNLELFKYSNFNIKRNKKNVLTVGYIGTHGISQGLDFILNSISLLKIKDFEFQFIGSGACRENLIRLSQKLELKNVTFINEQERKNIPNYYSNIDVALVCLKKNEIFERVIPSKIFEACAMGKPILLGVDGEAKFLVDKYKAGVFFSPENHNAFKESLYLLKNKLRYQEYKNGSLKLSKDYSREKLAKEMLDLIQKVYYSSKKKNKLFIS